MGRRGKEKNYLYIWVNIRKLIKTKSFILSEDVGTKHAHTHTPTQKTRHQTTWCSDLWQKHHDITMQNKESKIIIVVVINKNNKHHECPQPILCLILSNYGNQAIWLSVNGCNTRILWSLNRPYMASICKKADSNQHSEETQGFWFCSEDALHTQYTRILLNTHYWYQRYERANHPLKCFQAML